MALRVAVANGNWSNPATWNGGVIPSDGDIVAANNFTVTIDQNVNVDTLTDAPRSVINAIPTMTSDTSPSGVASGSFTNTGLTAYYLAFDKNVNNNFFAGTIVPGDYIQYEFATPIAIDQFTMQFGGSTTTSMSFQAWNGSIWVNLITTSSSAVSVFTSSLVGNSTQYTKYRLVFNTAMYIQLRELYFYEYLGTTAAVAGGGFILNNGVTVTASGGGFIAYNLSILITYSLASGNSATLVGNIYPPTTVDGTPTVLHSGTGTLYHIGNVFCNTRSGTSGILVSSGGTLNMTGYVYSTTTVANQTMGIQVTGGGATINLTGDVIWQCSSTSVSNRLIQITSVCSFYMTGTLNGGSSYGIICTSNAYLNIAGPIIAGMTIGGTIGAPALSSQASGAINILTGPFVSHSSGIMPFLCFRAHLVPTLNNYFEFRDSSTNGALPPAAPAPATRLVSPDTVVDAPIPANVRNGVSYALGTFTGTLKVPLPSQVSKGIQTDNTVGTAALTPEDVWNALTSSMTTPGSIGNRLKNTSTVETTGDQIASLL
jgi:hypothetical protein